MLRSSIALGAGLALVVGPAAATDLDTIRQRGALRVGAGLRVSAERKKLIDFSEEVMAGRMVVVTRRPAPKVETLRAPRAARVGVIPGTAWSDAARGAGVAQDRVVELADPDAVLAALGSGAIDATVTSVADLFMSLKRDPELQAGMPLGEPGSSAWGLRRQDAALRAAIDDYLRAFRQGPSWSRLVVIYFGDDALAVLGRANVK